MTLERAINTKKFADKVFVIEGRRIYCHRVVLVSRCDYFKNLLFSGMKEANEYITDLTSNYSYEVYASMIEYLYTDKLSNNISTDDLLDLVVLSSEYLLPRLKKLCEDKITRTADFALENCVSVYKFADTYQAFVLKEACTDFIVKNLSLVSTGPYSFFGILDLRSIREILAKAPRESAKLLEQYIKILEYNTAENMQKVKERYLQKEINPNSKKSSKKRSL